VEIPPWAEVIVEGKARIIAPKRDLFTRSDGVYEPAHAPVFYNPVMAFNRDVAVAVLNVYSWLYRRVESASDPMAATGVRGVRIALEVEGVSEVILNDADPLACRVMRMNVQLNSLLGVARIYCEDANQLMISLARSGVHVDYLDIDPYGSPIPYIEAASRYAGIGGLLGITATDLGPLTGRYPLKAYRRYRARVDPSVDFRKELGLRVLVASVASKASERDIALRPILAYYADHYYRVYLAVDMGASKADSVLSGIGYILSCPSCGYREAVGGAAGETKCPRCGSTALLLGPAWLGPLSDRGFAEALARGADSYGWLSTRDRIKELALALIEEDRVGRPFYYRIDSLARLAKANMPAREDLIECLRSMGYAAVRTHFDSVGVKTNAGIDDLIGCVRAGRA